MSLARVNKIIGIIGINGINGNIGALPVAISANGYNVSTLDIGTDWGRQSNVHSRKMRVRP
jgi:hypothetical protein